MWPRIPAIFLLGLLVVGVVTASSSSNDNNVVDEPSFPAVELMVKFKKWMDYHDVTYDTHDEKLTRFHIWLDNDGA